MCRSAASARPARSCRPPPSSPRPPSPATRISSPACRATSAAAAATSASSARSAAPPRECKAMLRHLELHAAHALPRAIPATVIAKVSRRGFLKGSAAFALAIHFLPADARAYETYPHGGLDMPNGVVSNPLVFVSIDRDGTVTIKAHRSEMGTGVRTSIPMVVADEMEADWARVRIVQAEGDEKKYGNQDTDGSRSLRHHIQPARDIGAAVRRMLEQAAAERWQTEVANVEAVNHEVVHKSLGLRLGYGALAEAAMALPVPARSDLTFKDEKAFRYIGKGTRSGGRRVGKGCVRAVRYR